LTGQIKKLASETVVYGLGTILPRSFNLLLVSLHTRVFPQDEYGTISELYGYVAFFNIIFLFGMETAFFRFSNRPDMDKARTFRLTHSVVVVISTLLSVGLLIFSNSIAEQHGINDKKIVVWIVLTMLVDALVAIPFAKLRLEKKAMWFTVFKLVNVFLLLGLNFYFLWYSKSPSPGIELVFLANLLANSIYLVFFFRDLILWRPSFDKKISPQILSYSIPIVLTGLAGMTNEMFSRIALDNWLPKDFYPGRSAEYMQGVFSACYKFSVFISLAVQAFRFAAEPFFFAAAGDKSSPQLFARVNHYFVLSACAMMVGICLNMEWLKYFVGPDSWEGLGIVPVLLLGYIFLGIYYNISVWFKVIDKTYFGTIIAVAGALITVALNYWLIPLFGIMGSAYVTLICYFTMTAACYALGQRYYPVPYTVAGDLSAITITCLIVFINEKIVIENVVASIALRGLATLIIFWIIYSITFRNKLGPAK
jgi:O-antigen/teichoic acid export membrane protein